jgi:predicted metalloprotease with PDZ domain
VLTIRYQLSFPDPHTHLYHVALELDGLDGPSVDLCLPVWTPGAYVVSDFARHVQDAACRRPWKKVGKNRWRVDTKGASSIRFTYRVWAFECEVDKSHLDGEHAYFNGAGLFMYVDGAKDRPVTLDIDVPKGWRVVTGLHRAAPSRFTAPNYDVLIDCPTEIGTAPMKTFKVDGKEHRVVIHGANNWGLERVTRDAEKLVRAQKKLFGELPYEHYSFIYHAVTSSALGGLEHLNSTSLTLNPWIGRPAKEYERVIEVTSHEFFHLWNVKRIHPKVLGPFDYDREVYTKLLWVMEGVTSYYDDLFCCRAKLYDAKRYLKKIAEAVQRFREKPSRKRQSLTQSSFDTWLWRYKADGNIVNRMMSYYEKGGLVGLCLDLEIRRRTRNRRSLDDVMRHLWTGYAKEGRTLEEDEFLPVVERVSGVRFGDFFAKYVDGTAEVPFESFLRVAGLELRREAAKADGEKEPDRAAWLGVATRNGPERPVVTTVTEGSPAWRDGIYPDDEIVALDDLRIDNANFATHLKERRPGAKAVVTVFRGPRMVDVDVTLGARENVTWDIRPRAAATAAEKAVYGSWLGAPWPKKEKPV